MSTLRVEALEQPDGTAFVFNNKNLLINGGMNVWQRSTSTSVSTDAYHTADRWKDRVSGLGVFTVSRSTDVPSGQGFGYSMKWDCTTADASPAAGDFAILEQKMEGQNLQHLLYGNSGAKKLTASFWVKSNKTGVYTCGFYSADNSGRHIESSFTINSASTWEKKEITFDGDTVSALDNDNAESLKFWIWLGAGSNFSSGTHATTWAAYAQANVLANSQVNLADSTSNEFYITGCQLEVGSTASGFEFEPYQTVFKKCQRYTYKISPNVDFGPYGSGTCTGTNSSACVRFPEMRDSPSVTFGPAANRFQVIDGVSGYQATAMTADHITKFSITAKLSNTALVAGRPAILRQFNLGSSYILLDSEL